MGNKWLILLLVISATQAVSSCSQLPPECLPLGCLVQYVYICLGLHPYSMLFCISSVIERNLQFCDLFLIKWPKKQGVNKRETFSGCVFLSHPVLYVLSMFQFSKLTTIQQTYNHSVLESSVVMK